MSKVTKWQGQDLDPVLFNSKVELPLPLCFAAFGMIFCFFEPLFPFKMRITTSDLSTSKNSYGDQMK